MHSIKTYLYEQELLEGLKYFRLSKRIEKLIKKVKDKFIQLPGKEKPDAQLLIEILQNEILPAIKKAENDYAKGKLGKQEALEVIRKMKPKFKEAKKILQGHNLLPKIDWWSVVSIGLWVPIALTGQSALELFRKS
jgi:hypothetical protein